MICPKCQKKINYAFYSFSESGKVTLDSDKTGLYYNPINSEPDAFICPECGHALAGGDDEETLIDLFNNL